MSKWRIITCSPLQVAFHHGVCHSQLEAFRTDPVPEVHWEISWGLWV